MLRFFKAVSKEDIIGSRTCRDSSLKRYFYFQRQNVPESIASSEKDLRRW